MTTTERTDTPHEHTTAGAVVSFGYGLVCYAGFVMAFLYAVAFLADVVVPRTVDHGGPDASTPAALVLDAVLLGVFAAQHSVMARPAFKDRWVALVPRHVERSTYVLASTAALVLAFWQWRPIPTTVWDVPTATAPWLVARWLLWALYAAGWLWVLAMSFAIDHFAFMGLRQVADRLRGLGERSPVFARPWPYRLVRHPMMLGFFVAFWAAPTMTVGHLLFALLGSAYIVVGVLLEERDLSASLTEYDAYAAVTPRFLPRP
jgi:protein-S-isoprenylcysteine O-methyltransferase Ste14